MRLFLFFLACSFTLGAIGYFPLRMIMPHGWVFGGLYRMLLYHWAYPLHYIGLVSLVYAAVATPVVFRFGNQVYKWPHLMIPFIMLASILIASPAGGVLWVIHDMRAGYFPEGSRFWNDIGWGAATGAITGWLIILLSVPYNICGLIAGYYVTSFGYKMTLRKNETQHPMKTSRSGTGANVKTTNHNQPV